MKVYAVYSSDGANPTRREVFSKSTTAEEFRKTYKHLTKERLSVVPIEVKTTFAIPEFIACDYKDKPKDYEFFNPCFHGNNEKSCRGFVIYNIPFNQDVEIMKKFVDEKVKILKGK